MRKWKSVFERKYIIHEEEKIYFYSHEILASDRMYESFAYFAIFLTKFILLSLLFYLIWSYLCDLMHV